MELVYKESVLLVKRVHDLPLFFLILFYAIKSITEGIGGTSFLTVVSSDRG